MVSFFEDESKKEGIRDCRWDEKKRSCKVTPKGNKMVASIVPIIRWECKRINFPTYNRHSLLSIQSNRSVAYTVHIALRLVNNAEGRMSDEEGVE